MRLHRDETVAPFLPQTREFAARCLAGDHLRRPRSALGLPAHAPSRKPAAHCGCADHHARLNAGAYSDDLGQRALTNASI